MRVHRGAATRAVQACAQRDQPGASTSGRGDPADGNPFPFDPIAALAAGGCAETAYLTLAKLTHSPVACPLSGGCASVLTSDYALLLGLIPLSAAGMMTYGGVAAAAVAGRRAALQGDAALEAQLRTAVTAGGVLLATTSAYLMYVLFTAFPGETCPWCVASAGLSASIAALAARAMRRRELEDAVAPGAGLVAATLLVLSLGLGSPAAIQAGTGITELEFKQTMITTESSGNAVALARRLRDAGAQMFGAFWCSHCYEQKQVFGKEAMEVLPYVECFPEGWRQGVEMAPACKVAELKGFPTWIINGERLEGDQTLETLQAVLDKVPAAAVAPATS